MKVRLEFEETDLRDMLKSYFEREGFRVKNVEELCAQFAAAFPEGIFVDAEIVAAPSYTADASTGQAVSSLDTPSMAPAMPVASMEESDRSEVRLTEPQPGETPAYLAPPEVSDASDALLDERVVVVGADGIPQLMTVRELRQDKKPNVVKKPASAEEEEAAVRDLRRMARASQEMIRAKRN